MDKIVALLEQAYQESRQRLKQAVQLEGPSAGTVGEVATPVKNESHSTFSPSVAVITSATTETNKGVPVDSVGSTPSSSKGIFYRLFFFSSSKDRIDFVTPHFLILSGDDKSHITSTKKSSKIIADSPPRSPSLSPSDKQRGKDRNRKSRHHGHHHHHRKKRSRSRSRSRTRSRSRSRDGKRRERERDRPSDKDKRRESAKSTTDKYESRSERDRDRDRDKERDYKYRSKDNALREEKRDAKKERSRHRDRSLSRDRRR